MNRKRKIELDIIRGSLSCQYHKCTEVSRAPQEQLSSIESKNCVPSNWCDTALNLSSLKAPFYHTTITPGSGFQASLGDFPLKLFRLFYRLVVRSFTAQDNNVYRSNLILVIAKTQFCFSSLKSTKQ